MRWFLIFVVSCSLAVAQTRPKTKPVESKPAEATTTQPSAAAISSEEKDAPAIKGLTWRLVGPFRGGRVLAVSGVVGDANTFYFGGVGGGVWKSNDSGTTWRPVADKERIGSVGAIAVAESDKNVIYVGTGESCWRGDTIPGEGVFKSTDAGKSWKFAGLKDTRHIAKIVIHPKDPNLVYLAAMGHAHGPNAERGVYRSKDGGANWEKVLFKDDKTGAVDLSMDPSNPNIIFAGLYQAQRLPWDYLGGGPGSGLYRSGDGGTTWKKLEGNGLPPAPWGKVGVSVSGANPNRVWAQIEAEPKGGLYRSDDGGEKWQLVNDDRRFRQRAWYYTHIQADPKNADTIYSLNVQFFRSIDGGRTFRQIQAPHGDNHGIWIDPSEPRRMINGNDGGATVSVNGGETWSPIDNQPTSQFYHVITDNQVPYRIYGAQQDNSTVSIASRTDRFGIGRPDWHTVGGCESGYIAPHPKDPNIVYAGCYGGHITRYDHKTQTAREVMAWPLNPLGSGAAELKYRWQWTAPIVFSPHDANVLYHAANKVLMTTDEGKSWTEISPDLTRNDKTKQQSAGGAITKDNTSVEYYGTVFALVESPLQKGVIWAGSDDGLIHITRDGGKNWANVTPKDLPESRVSLIDASKFEAGTAYVAVDRHEFDDFAPYVLMTTDFGQSWRRIQGDLPQGAFVRAVRADHVRKDLLFAGTERGVFYTLDGGQHWKSLQRNLPMSSMRDLAVHENDLVVATHGRSFWVLDDISPLREWKPELANADVHFFKPGANYRITGGPGGRGFTGQNPPNGVIFYYHLKNALKAEEKPRPEEPEKQTTAPAQTTPAPSEGEAEKAARTEPAAEAAKTPIEAARKPSPINLEILDSAGNVVRTYPPKFPPTPPADAEGPAAEQLRAQELPGEAGLNRFNWDLRYEAVENVPGAVLWGGGTQGPIALPGRYQARLTIAGKSYTQPVEVKADPRSTSSADDLKKQFDLLMRIQQRVGEMHRAVNQIRDIRRQVNDLTKRLAEAKDPREGPIAAAGKALDAKLTSVEEALIQTKSKSNQDPLNYGLKLNNQMAALGGELDGDDAAPTTQAYAVFDFLSRQIDEQLAKYKAIADNDLKAFTQLTRERDIPAIIIKAGD